MKKASFIVNHLRSSPKFKNLQKEQSLKKLLLFLPKSFTNGIQYMYHKNNTIFFALKHQVYLFEFKSLQRSDKYRKNFIKTKLNELINIDSSCKCIKADNIKAFLAPKVEKQEQNLSSLPLYIERSQAKFKNQANNVKLHKIFEEIRQIICSKIA